MLGQIKKVFGNALLIFTIVFSAFSVPAAAEGQDEDSEPNEFSSSMRFMPSSTAKHTGAKVQMAQSEIEYSRKFKAFGRLPIVVSLGAEYIGLNNSSGVKLPAQLAVAYADIEVTLPFFNFRNTYFRTAVTPSFCADSWDFDVSDFRIPFRNYLVYEANKKLIFVAGAVVYPNCEDDVSPIAGVIYIPNDKLVFNITTDNPSISYALNRRLTLFLEGDVNIEEFEISQGFVTQRVLRYGESYLGSGVEYELNKYASASFSMGGTFNRALKYRGSGQGKVSLENGFYTQFNLGAEF